jgi:hypothetical protein
MYINQVKRNLPRPLRELLKDTTFKNWTEFLNAVRSVKAGTLKEEVEDWEDRHMTAVSLKKQMSQITAALSGVTIAQRNNQSVAALAVTRAPAPAPNYQYEKYGQPQRAPAPAAAVRQTGAGRGTPGELTAQQQDKLRESVTEWPHHPNTREGNAAYQAQITEFRIKYGEDPFIRYDTPVPLKPGTSPLKSRECYRCGMADPVHLAADCQNAEIPPLERKWRAYVGRHLRRATTAVNWAGFIDPPVEWQGAEGAGQGNGGGL